MIFLSDFPNKVCMPVFPKSVIRSVNFTLYVSVTIVLLAAEFKLRSRGMKKAGKIPSRQLSTAISCVDIIHTLSNAQYPGCSWKRSVQSCVAMSNPCMALQPFRILASIPLCLLFVLHRLILKICVVSLRTTSSNLILNFPTGLVL